jgi:LacI family transcriptional regulator
MRDVAERAGVSLKTVSRVVNGEAYVHADTLARVQQAIAELGFRPNDIARNLRQGQATATIGLVIEDIANPFYSQVAKGVEAIAHAKGSLVIMVSSEEDPQREQALVQSLFRRRVDGLIMVPAARDHSYLKQEMQLGTPIVFVDRPPQGLEADTIVLENRSGTQKAVEHLIQKGHRRIGFIGGYPQVFTGAERLEGFHAAHAAAKLKIDPNLIQNNRHDWHDAEAAMKELLDLKNPPTAVFTTSNRQTLGAVRALHQRGAKVELVGFDDLELLDLLPVPVSVLRHDPSALGVKAAELLFARLEGKKGKYQQIEVPVELVLAR